MTCSQASRVNAHHWLPAKGRRSPKCRSELLTIALAVWLGLGVIGTGSVYWSEETGSLQYADAIVEQLHQLLRARRPASRRFAGECDPRLQVSLLLSAAGALPLRGWNPKTDRRSGPET